MEILPKKYPFKFKQRKLLKSYTKNYQSSFFLKFKKLALQTKNNRNSGNIKSIFIFLVFLFLIYLTVLSPLIKTGARIVKSTTKKIDTVQDWVQDNFYKISPLLPPYYGKSDKFLPYVVHTPYLIDDTPPGAYDFTLELNSRLKVPIPAPCEGTIRQTRFQGRNGSLRTAQGAGQIVELFCDGTNYYWLMGHLVKGSPPRKGTRIKKGQAIGIQGLTGRTSGYHVHAQIHYNSGQRITNRKVTRSLVENYIKLLRKGKF